MRRARTSYSFKVAKFLLACLCLNSILIARRDNIWLSRRTGVGQTGERTHCGFFRRTPRPLNRRQLPLLDWDVNLNFYPSRQGSRPFVACVYPKIASSQWIHLLHFLRTGEVLGNVGLKIHEEKDREHTAIDTSLEKDVNILLDSSIKRLLITRNPYDRVVSAYFDMKRRDQRNGTFTFGEFVYQYLVLGKKDTNQPEDHRIPFTSGCNIWNATDYRYSLQWNYILKLEEMSLWSSCLLDDLQLRSITSKGWATKSGRLFEESIDPSFPLLAFYGQLMGFVKWPSTQAYKVGHERHTREWASMYTPQLVKYVNEIYASDFIVGGYPLWDGVRGNERLH